MVAGKFIVIEGLEGAGKSTIQQKVVEILSSLGVKQLLCAHEPGGTPLATQIRRLLVGASAPEAPTALCGLLLLYAARHQLIDTVIRPALKAGTWVISDRHNLSSYAYQGAGRGLPFSLIDALSDAVLGDLKPDLTLYLDVDPEIGRARALKRGALDRIEREALVFFGRVRAYYQQVAREEPMVIQLDANGSLDWADTQLRHCLKNWLTDIKPTC